MKLPKSWEDINIAKYVLLRAVDSSDLNIVERPIRKLEIITGKRNEEVERLSVVEVAKIKEQLSFLDTDIPLNTLENEITINDVTYFFEFNCKSLNSSQYTSVSTKLKALEKDKDYIHNNLHEILLSISTIKGVDPMKLPEDYYAKTKEIFYTEIPITVAYPICVFFLRSFEALNEIYSGLFEREISDPDKGSQGRNDGIIKKWGWWFPFDTLANGDFEKWEYYQSMNVVKFLNICAFNKDKSKLK